MSGTSQGRARGCTRLCNRTHYLGKVSLACCLLTRLAMSCRSAPCTSHCCKHSYLALSADAKDLLLKMLADDPKARPTCMEVLKHPFMTADESNAAAHREMGDLVRNRMRDLAKIR